MRMDKAGEQALETREGKRNTAYRDSVGVWTIGVGHAHTYHGVPIHAGMRLTDAEVDALFHEDIEAFQKHLDALIKVSVNQNQWNAAVSFAFNIGINGFTGSSFLRYLNAGDYGKAADAMLMWEKPPELKKRREGERAQFLTPMPKVASTIQTKNSATNVAHSPAMVQKKEATMTTTITTAPTKTDHVDVLAGIENFFNNIVGTVKSGITAAEATSIPQVSTGNIVSDTVSDAEAAIKEIEEVIGHIQAKKYTDSAEDVLQLLTIVFRILARYGVNVPGATMAIGIATKIAAAI